MKPYFACLAGVLLASCVAPDFSATPTGATIARLGNKTIPAKFHGIWTTNPSGKHPGDAEGPSVISATTWQSHESLAEVQSVQIGGENEITILAVRDGEGEQWTERKKLQLSADGNELKITDLVEPYRYSLYRVR